MNYILAFNDDLSFNGFYVEGIHDVIPSPNIRVSQELWEYLVDLDGNFKLIDDFFMSVLEGEEYTLAHKHLFEVKVVELEELPLESTLEERIDTLEMENAELLLESARKDIRIDSLEMENSELFLESAKKDIRLDSLEQDMADIFMEFATMMKEV